MPVLTKVESKGWRGKLFLGGVTLALIIGGTTMVYPFLLMLSGAMRSDMDASDMSVVPEYLVDEDDLVRKFLEAKYDFDVTVMNRSLQTEYYRFRDVTIPSDFNQSRVDDLDRFISEADYPDHWMLLGGTRLYRQVSCVKQRQLVATLRDRFDDDIAAFNAEMGAPVRQWWQINIRLPNLLRGRAILVDDPLHEAYFDIMRESDPAYLAPVNISGHFLDRLIKPRYGTRGYEEWQEKNDLDAESYMHYNIPQRVPSPEYPEYREEWLEFVYEGHIHMSYVRSDAPDEDYQAFLEERFDDIETLNLYWSDRDYNSFEDITLPGDHEWVKEYEREIYEDFIKTLEPESLRLVGPEFAWRNFLEDAYGDLEAVSETHGVNYASFEDIRIPLLELETAHVLDNARSLKLRYAGRNFGIVARQMFVQGRPFLNTIIFVILGLCFTLTVMPLVAYSLARFNPPGKWKIIFIFVATMAFPPMVDMIPRFLIIQRLGLLNTFIALVLPLTINGMMIFLLMGFFESLPQDLYDAAVIDGASELRIFWQITMSMSKPILAVVALGTFNAAWRMFLYPLIVAPDESMHVLAVWLQQFQLDASQSAVFASIILASLPSLLIFIFAQRVIMRGIAVPSEK